MNNSIEDTDVLRQVVEKRQFSNAIINIAEHTWWVDESSRILDVADELQKWPGIPVIAILNKQGQLVGILEREQLFVLIGKPFGREVFQRSSVLEISKYVQPMDYRLNILTVAQQIRDRVFSESNLIPLVDENDQFQGIFSVQDLNEYLSRMIQDDIQLAGQLQERMLSNSTVSVPGAAVRAWTRSAKGVGGDFFFIQELPGEKIFTTLCDVSGKGLAASLVVSMVWGMLNSYDFRRGLKELIRNLNRAVVSTFHMEKYLTGFFCIIDPGSKKMIFADMGHSHVVLSRNSKPIPLKARNLNLPIGIDQEMECHLASITLRNGDRILVYTDGMTEQKNKNSEEFGERRLYNYFISAQDQETFEKQCMDQFDAFRESVPQQDDVSLLTIFFS
jgi:sigma-B regulation protein RsbU (phosphoserine phosphatase)